MQTIERTWKTDEEYANLVLNKGRGLFRSKETRDHVWKLCQEWGYTLKRKTISNQNLHPEYVTDYVGTLETGFGNTQYQTFWSKLYELRT